MPSAHRPPCDGRAVILHVVNSLDRGGIETTLLRLMQRVDHARRRHVIVTMRDAGALAAAIPDEVACRALRVTGRSRLAWTQLGRLARAWDASVVHARGTGCWADALLSRALHPRAKLLLSYHGLERASEGTDADRAPPRGGAVSYALGPRLCRLARWADRFRVAFTCVSESGASQLVEEAGVAPQRVHLLRNGVDVHHFPVNSAARAEIRARLRIDEADVVVASVGSLTRVKRLDRLISGVAAVRRRGIGACAVLLGDGPLRGELRTLAEKCGMRDACRFVGAQDDVPRWLSAMDIFACASESEGMSNAVLEAMASGLAVVATRVGDNPALIQNGVHGILCESGDQVAFEEAIVQLSQDAAHRTHLGSNARARANEYSFDRTVAAYEALYDRLTDGHRPQHGRQV